MDVNPLSYLGMAWAWIRENYVVALVVLVALAVGILAWIAYKKFGTKRDVRRDAVRRALKSRFKSARARRKRGQEVWTDGNQDTEETCWGKTVGLSETSYAVFAEIQPRRGFFKMFRRKKIVFPRHLVPDMRTRQIRVRALGFALHEGVWWPDDDLTDPLVRDAWTQALSVSGETPDAIGRDMPGLIHQWYQRVIGLDVAAQEGVTMVDNWIYNIHTAMASSLDDSRHVMRDGRPELSHEPRRSTPPQRSQEVRQRG